MRTTRRLRDLTPRQRRLLLALVVVQYGLAAVAARDLARRPAEQVRGPKWAWGPALALNFAGPLSYLRWGRKRPSGTTPDLVPDTC